MKPARFSDSDKLMMFRYKVIQVYRLYRYTGMAWQCSARLKIVTVVTWCDDRGDGDDDDDDDCGAGAGGGDVWRSCRIGCRDWATSDGKQSRTQRHQQLRRKSLTMSSFTRFAWILKRWRNHRISGVILLIRAKKNFCLSHRVPLQSLAHFILRTFTPH